MEIFFEEQGGELVLTDITTRKDCCDSYCLNYPIPAETPQDQRFLFEVVALDQVRCPDCGTTLKCLIEGIDIMDGPTQ